MQRGKIQAQGICVGNRDLEHTEWCIHNELRDEEENLIAFGRGMTLRGQWLLRVQVTAEGQGFDVESSKAAHGACKPRSWKIVWCH
eukprot:scaffold644_cov357-Pavlova_lutheri.AAC.47